MDAVVDVTKLSNENLCGYFWAFYDAENTEVFSEIRRRSEEGALEPLHDLLYSYHFLSNSVKTEMSKYLNSDLFRDFIKSGITHGVFDSEEVNQASSIRLVSWIFSKVFKIKKVGDLTPEIWMLGVRGLKQEGLNSGKWKATTRDKFRNGFTRMARILSISMKDESFQNITRAPRSVSKVSVLSSSLPDPRFNSWLTMYQQWVNFKGVKSTKELTSAFRRLWGFLSDFADKSEIIYDPLAYLTTNYSDRPSFYGWSAKKEMVATWDRREMHCGYLHQFCDWIIQEHLTDYDEDTGESLVVGHQLLSPSEYTTINIGGRAKKSNKLLETPKKIMPRMWMNICKDILTGNDFEWPKSRDNDYILFDGCEGEPIKIWNPVYAYVYLLMLELPLRKIQVLSLDSGEGDMEKYDAELGKFAPNDGVHANTWKKRVNKKVNRGVITKLYSQGKELAGLYINTNKTQDSIAGFGENTGYEIPWQNTTVIKLLSDLRKWQEKYNPVKGPRKYSDIPKSVFTRETSDSARESIPDRFYLFRCPPPISGGRGLRTWEDPPTERRVFQFWYDLMSELERRLRANGEDVKIVKYNASGQAESAIFTPHGLRSSGLTALLEAGVPIGILSKIIAGHASILMTLHYIKYNPARVNDILSGAQKHIEESQQKEFSTWLKNASYEDITLNAALNDSEALRSVVHFNDQCLFECNSIGVCPYGGTRCHDGGAQSGRKELYGSVDEGDCLNCRHFITGAPWLVPLWLKGNKLLADSQKLSNRVDEINGRLQSCEDKRFAIVKEKGSHAITDSLIAEIKKEQALLSMESHKLDKVLNDSHAVHNLINKINALTGEAGRPPVLVSEDFDFSPDEEYVDSSRFRALDILVRSADVYTHVKDGDFEAERNQFIDKVMFGAGVTPISFAPLTADQKKIAHNAASGYLSSKLTDSEINSLEEGKITIVELGISGSEVVNSIKRISGADIPFLMLGGGN